MATSPRQQQHSLPAANHVFALTSPTESLVSGVFFLPFLPSAVWSSRYEEETALRASTLNMLPKSRAAMMSNGGRRAARDGLQWPKMYLWRLSIATGLGLAWYFSDCGRTVTQYLVCLLLCCCAPLLYANSGRESGTQTDEEAEKLSQVKATDQRTRQQTRMLTCPSPPPTPTSPTTAAHDLACCQGRSLAS